MKGRNYRSPSGQAFTRMKYIHGSPAPKVSKFNMGDLSTPFPRKLHLVAREHVQIRHNALESARVSANKILTDRWGETGYRLQLCVYPHYSPRKQDDRHRGSGQIAGGNAASLRQTYRPSS